jgi:hypothetical protein
MNARLPALALALLSAAWLAWAVAGWTRPWPGASTALADTDTPSAPTAEAPALPPPTDLASLTRLGLLGTAPRQETPPQESAPPAPPVERVPLTLMGTLPGPAPEQGLAILGGPEGQAAYRVGGELPGGARLLAVDALGVDIALGEARERLDLPVASTEPAAQPMLPAGLGGKPGATAPKAGAGAPLPGQGTVATARQRLQELRRLQEERRRSGGAAPPAAKGTPSAAAIPPGTLAPASTTATASAATGSSGASTTAAGSTPSAAASGSTGAATTGSGFVQATPGATGTAGSGLGFELGSPAHFEMLRKQAAERPPTPSAYPLPPP